MIPAPRAPADDGLDELRARRRALADRLAEVRYWRRVVRGETDVLVASLLYGPGHGLEGAAPPAAAREDWGRRLEGLRERAEGLARDEAALGSALELLTCELGTRVVAAASAASPAA